jgi:hypothetical protein
LENLKQIWSNGWVWLTRLKRSRKRQPDGTGNIPLHQVKVAAMGTVVHLQGA